MGSDCARCGPGGELGGACPQRVRTQPLEYRERAPRALGPHRRCALVAKGREGRRAMIDRPSLRLSATLLLVGQLLDGGGPPERRARPRSPGDCRLPNPLGVSLHRTHGVKASVGVTGP